MNRAINIVIIIAGIGLIIAALLPNSLPLAAVMAGIGFICFGLLQIVKEQEKKQVAEKFGQLMEKLEKIEKLGEKLEQPKNTGIAIADGLLKLYTDYLSNPKEAKNDD